MNKHIHNILLLALLSCTVPLFAQRTSLEKQSEELGKVRWYRDYDEAIAIAQQEDKNVLLLFQEVPGCATCRNYGHNVLSHPLMVEAIENLFVPLAIFNNKTGKDRAILNRFNEPTWNNPVVRIINAEAKNLIPRIAGDYSAITLCRKMKEVLHQEGVVIPEYLNLLEQELAADAAGSRREQHFKMYCFWSGEKQLGKAAGVLQTESGFMKGSEVVKVTYDKNQIDEHALIAFAEKHNFVPITPNSSYRVATKDVHYYLQGSPYQYLPLTDLQQTKINSALGSNQSAKRYLSPKQLQWLERIEAKNTSRKVLFQEDFAKAWTMMDKQV